jgi:peptidoglycan/LPS O-acetylase OafA/YrhL
MEVRSKFRYSIENFRGLAIVFVILSHVSYFRPIGHAGDYGYFIVGDATSWFVFISGYLFCYIERSKFSYDKYIEKKAWYVVLPYLVVSLPAILSGLYFSRHILLGLSTLSYILWSLVVGGSVVAPLWFVPMIVLFFAASPIFHWLSRSWLISLAAVIGIGFSLLSSRPIGDLNPFLSFLHFLGFYLLGVAFATNAAGIDKLLKKTWAGWAIIGLAGAGFFLSAHLYDESANQLNGFYDGLWSFNALQFGKLSLLIVMFCGLEMLGNRKSKILSYLASVSFGLFFVHGFYVVLFYKISQHIHITGSSMSLFAEVALVFFGSIVTVDLIKRATGKGSRYVIGC